MVSYKDAGVDVDGWNKTALRMKGIVRQSFNRNVLTELGSFGGAFSAKPLQAMKEPVLVSTMDGVGTKMKVAKMMNKYDTVGFDIVNHSSNDILCVGAKPLFFLDYIAGEKLDNEIVLQKGEILPRKDISEGDVLIALPSTGLHTNGYSLARKVFFDGLKMDVNDKVTELKTTVGKALLEPHKSYSNLILNLKNKSLVKGIAHITGGGLVDNVPRILPKGKGALIDEKNINILPLFSFLLEKGRIPKQDAWQAFNMGVGLVVVSSEADSSVLISEMKSKGGKPYPIGKVVKGKGVKII